MIGWDLKFTFELTNGLVCFAGVTFRIRLCLGRYQGNLMWPLFDRNLSVISVIFRLRCYYKREKLRLFRRRRQKRLVVAGGRQATANYTPRYWHRAAGQEQYLQNKINNQILILSPDNQIQLLKYCLVYSISIWLFWSPNIAQHGSLS